MKKLFSKIITICFALVLITNIINITENFAATYSFSFTGPTQASTGDTLTYTISANGLTGNVKLSGSNVSLSASQTWVERNTVTITAKVTGFPASVTATPVELTDNDYEIVSLAPRTININQKQTTPPVTQPEPSNGGEQSQNPGQTNNQGQTGTQGQTSSQGQGSNAGQPSNQGQSGTRTQTSNNNQKTTGSRTNTQTNNNQGSNNQSVTLSSNNYLKNLQVNVGTLSPEFYRETFEYTVDNIIEDDIEVTAEAEDEKAIVNGAGTIALAGGENRIKIDVVAENQQTRTYTIIVNKNEEVTDSEARLQTLEIQTINEDNMFEDLDIGFDKEVLDYETTVEDNVTDLSISATVDREGIIIDVEGDKNLKEGENIVTITLTENNETETKKTTYTIKVNRKAKPIVEISSNGVSSNQILAGAILSILAIGLIIIAVTTHIKKHKK